MKCPRCVHRSQGRFAGFVTSGYRGDPGKCFNCGWQEGGPIRDPYEGEPAVLAWEAALRLGISKSALYQRIRSGSLKARKIQGGEYRVFLEQLA